MAKAIIMPKFGFTQETAEIVAWLKQDGDEVEAGDPIAEVTTDKVNMEVEAPETGILTGLRFKEGDTVPVTEVIAYIVKPGEAVPEEAPAVAGEPAETPSQPAQPAAAETDDRGGRVKATPVAEQYAREKGIDLAAVSGSGPGGRVTRTDLEKFITTAAPQPGKVRATPAARHLSQEMQVDISQVQGSGPQGRVQGEDVRRWKQSQQAPYTTQAAPEAQSAAPAQAQVVPMSNMRRIIAERLSRSAQEAPHIYFDADVDAGAIERLSQRANERLAEGQPKISLTVILLKMVAWALKRHPYMNSRLDGTNIVLLPNVNLGVAVALEEGLVVPVVKDVDQKSTSQLATELGELVERARQNRLRPDDVSEGTFTISNLGMFGVDRFTAIINPPQTAILAVGRIRRAFVPDENDQPVARPILSINLGADHRVVDGAIAARFLADLRECIEYPEIMAL